MARTGRPKKVIDYELAGKLAMIQCTEIEIAGLLEVSVRTLQNDAEFLRVFSEKKELGKSSLRRMQWKKAEQGNVTMQIWLGKQYLGQRDIPIDNKEDEKKLDRLVSAIEANIQLEAEGSAADSERPVEPAERSGEEREDAL